MKYKYLTKRMFFFVAVVLTLGITVFGCGGDNNDDAGNGIVSEVVDDPNLDTEGDNDDAGDGDVSEVVDDPNLDIEGDNDDAGDSDDAGDGDVSEVVDDPNLDIEGDNNDGAEDDSRIVSMSPTATESLFAIGAGPLVVAADDQSNFPPEAPTTDLSGFGANVEAIAAYEPDLVVMWFDPGDVQAGLETLDIEVLFQPAPATLEGAYDQILALGETTGQSSEAEQLVESMKSRIEELVGSVPVHQEQVTFFHEVDSTLYSLTSDTFAGSIYSLFGLSNIADPEDADGSAFGYPQLSEEYVIDADPDLIFLGDASFGESAQTVADRPGWETLSAVVNGNIVELDGDIAGRWGPRIVDYASEIADALIEISVAE